MIESIRNTFNTLFPKENRANATIAAWRTFKQTVKGAGIVGAGGGLILTGTDLATMDWKAWGLTAAAVTISAGLAALDAWTDVARNGLSPKYEG